MDSKSHENLLGIVQSSIEEFLSSNEPLAGYKSAMPHAPDQSQAATMVSVIGYSGDDVKGSLAIFCGRKLLDASHPGHAMGMPVGDAEIADWIGEVANQLMGRVKNKLASVGIKSSMGTPTNMTGKSIEISAPKGGVLDTFAFQGNLGDFCIYFVTVAKPDLSIQAVKQDSLVGEGASLLF